MSEPDLNVQLLAEGARRSNDLQRLLDAKIGKLELVEKDMESKKPAYKEKSRDYVRLEVEL